MKRHLAIVIIGILLALGLGWLMYKIEHPATISITEPTNGLPEYKIVMKNFNTNWLSVYGAPDGSWWPPNHVRFESTYKPVITQSNQVWIVSFQAP